MKIPQISAIRQFLEKRLRHRSKSRNCYLDIGLGLIIGIGGINEFTALGMTVWTAINWKNNWLEENQARKTWQDLVIISISILCILLFSFDKGWDTRGLTITEFLKVVIWGTFSLTLIRSKSEKLFSVVKGVALGLWFYALMILCGSLIYQPFQSARGQMYNIINSRVDASSSITSYTCAYSTLILLGIKSRFALPASLTCIVLGLHSLNRISLLVGIIALAYLIGSMSKSLIQQINLTKEHERNISTVVFVAGALTIAAIAGKNMVGSLSVMPIESINITARLQDIGSDPRYYLYNAGFKTLAQSMVDNDFEPLIEVNQAVSTIFPEWSHSEGGWHSLVLDSARGAGWIGLSTSLVWIAALGYSTVLAIKKAYGRYILLGIMQIFILLTSMPVALGHYELLGALTLTTLLIYSPAVKKSELLE